MTTVKKPKAKVSSCLFHPLELSLCGYSGAGKTTLVTRLLEDLSQDFNVGYFKSDAHRFQMDKEGKDTQRAWSSGARQVAIADPEHWASLRKGEMSLAHQRQLFVDCDFVLVEGRKQSELPKVVLIDQDQKILTDIKEGHIRNVQAFIGPADRPGELPLDLPYFQRDQVTEISAWIRRFFAKPVASRPLYGLVLAGGRSQRMQKDKATLQYYGRPQVEVVADMLRSRCDNVFLSCRQGQIPESVAADTPRIYDQLLDMGPTGGILSAMMKEPTVAWLVVACDLPFLQPSTLEQLVESRDPYKLVTAFISEFDGLPEPLCAVYEPRSYQRLFEFIGLGYRCPRKLLLHSSVHLVSLEAKRALDNINHPNEFDEALGLIQGGLK